MNHDILVLRALVRLSRSRSHVCLEALSVRSGGEIADVRASLVNLSRMGWIVRDDTSVRLTLAGLAVGVAASKRKASVAAPVADVRRRAA